MYTEFLHKRAQRMIAIIDRTPCKEHMLVRTRQSYKHSKCNTLGDQLLRIWEIWKRFAM